MRPQRPTGATTARREGDEVSPDVDVEIMFGKHNSAQRADQPKSANPRKCHKKRDAHDDTDDRR